MSIDDEYREKTVRSQNVQQCGGQKRACQVGPRNVSSIHLLIGVPNSSAAHDNGMAVWGCLGLKLRQLGTEALLLCIFCPVRCGRVLTL